MAGTSMVVGSICNSLASVPLLAPTWARTSNPLHTSTTATLEASLPIAPQKPPLAFLAKLDSRVVALESVLLVDGGETIVVQGLRWLLVCVARELLVSSRDM